MSINNPSPSSAPYYKKITLNELGVDSQLFLDHIRPVYEQIQWDMYDTLRGGLSAPTRKRALAEFAMEQNGSGWNITRVPAKAYEQSSNHGNYNRTEPRVYPEVDQTVTDHAEVRALQSAIGDIVQSVRSDAQKLRMIFTFLRTVDEEGRSGVCALEGTPHIDGMDYIVSALVVNRKNLLPETGQSSVYTLEQEKLLETVLQPGEGIFQDDINLMHHITNIQRDVQSIPGIRDMLGIDVQILS